MDRNLNHHFNLALHRSTMDCKPVVLMSIMLITIWFMLTYLVTSYFVIFVTFSMFIFLFACCVSLSGYALRRYIDNRQEPPPVIEVSTISGTTAPYIMPEYPPSYEEAVRSPSLPAVPPYQVINPHALVTTCVICAEHRRNLLKNTAQQASGDSPLPQRHNVNGPSHQHTICSIESHSSSLPSVDSVNSPFSTPHTSQRSSTSYASTTSTDSVFVSSSRGEPPPYQEEESRNAEESHTFPPA